ncbi:hypothetical protein ACFY05_32170 [Microtetraspora fusca]|uniref:DUF3168 domain-containing protein n=1 Tax=Microtetraspora fusca TaxID=1997 RepID=A0ABW6VEV3_MICFU
MAADDLARADPLPRVITWLGAHPLMVAELGGVDRVGLVNKPPYPRIRITDPPGDDRDLRWLLAPVVQIEAYGDLDGSPGKAQLRWLLYLALGVLKELPEQETPAAGPVITEVESLLGGSWQPEPNGQPRYLAQVRVYCHPVPA